MPGIPNEIEIDNEILRNMLKYLIKQSVLNNDQEAQALLYGWREHTEHLLPDTRDALNN